MDALRVLAVVAAIILVLLGARWARKVLFQSSGAVPVTSSTPTELLPTTTPSPSPPAVLHRLAGVALGNVRYVVVAQPDGGTALYRLGEEVPGLGRIVEVTENSATFDGESGRIRLRITAPPSPTLVLPSPTPLSPTSVPVTPSPAPAHTASGSPPSGDQDQSAS